MTTTVKAGGAGQFIALVPAMLGYQPVESLVVVPFAGTRSIGAIRFDLPHVHDLDAEKFAATVVGMGMRVDRADGIAVIAWTAQPHESTLGTLSAIATQTERAGLRLVDSLFVAADGWGSTIVGDMHSLDELELVPEEVRHLPVAASQSAGTDVIELDEQVLMDAREILAGYSDMTEAGAEIVAAMLVATAENVVVEGEDHTGYPAILGWAAAMLGTPGMRDVLLIHWATERGHEALLAQLAWDDGEEYPRDLAQIMWGEGPRPDAKRLERGLALARAAAVVGEDSDRAGCYATAAWLSWALGRSTHAELFAQRAFEAQPEHGLAEIVQSFVTAGHLPNWAFTKGDN